METKTKKLIVAVGTAFIVLFFLSIGYNIFYYLNNLSVQKKILSNNELRINDIKRLVKLQKKPHFFAGYESDFLNLSNFSKKRCIHGFLKLLKLRNGEISGTDAMIYKDAKLDFIDLVTLYHVTLTTDKKMCQRDPLCALSVLKVKKPSLFKFCSLYFKLYQDQCNDSCKNFFAKHPRFLFALYDTDEHQKFEEIVEAGLKKNFLRNEAGFKNMLIFSGYFLLIGLIFFTTFFWVGFGGNDGKKS